MPTFVPPLLSGLIDDAAVFPPGSATLPDAVRAHRSHRAAWYAGLIGPLLVPASSLKDLPPLIGAAGPDGRITVGIVADLPVEQLGDRLAGADPRIDVRQVEVAVAKRGEDPQPGIARLLGLGAQWPALRMCAEVPLTGGLLAALDTLAEARAEGRPVVAKFRTGGLAAELFPTPVELAAVICACRDRGLPFKLTAGLHHALRRTDPETGFVHHGFFNVLAGVLAAASGAEVADVAELLAATVPVPLVERSRAHRDEPRPLWVGFGSCDVMEPLTDLIRLGLINGGYE